MKVAIYPGSSDPISNGERDLIDRALELFDKLYVAIATNPVKEPLFTAEERMAMVKQLTKNRKGVTVISFPGLLADLSRKLKAVAIIRGLRAVADFEYEFQMALMNRKLSHGA